MENKPNYAEAYHELAYVQLLQGKEGWRETFREAREPDPCYIKGLFLVGHHVLTRREGQGILRETTRIKPETAEDSYYQGRAYAVLGMDNEAINSYKKKRQ